MRTVRYCAVVLTLFAASGCSRSADPPPLAGETSSQAPATSQNQPTGSAAPLSGLAAALGVGGLPIPEGLVPGGDCPPPPPDAEQEIAAQAQATVPLQEGLTLAYQWMRTPQEPEYECLIQVKKVEASGILTTLSCDAPGGRGPFLRRVCRADLRSAGMLHTLYGAVKVIGPSGEEEPETITGATAFTLSTDDFARLNRTGGFTHHYVELKSSNELAKDGVGELRVESRETMDVILNDRPVTIPVIKTRGVMKYWIRGQRLETEDTLVVLDDERFPLIIDQQDSNEKAASRIYFSKITSSKWRGFGAPGGGPLSMRGGSLEAGLADNKRVDVYGIYFDFNSDQIRPESEPVLEEISSIMKSHPEWRLSIQGHTDNIGGDGQYNLELSRRRSAAVVSALVSRFGISAERLTSGGSGAASPRDTNDTPEGRARNRRVELVRQ